MLGPLRAEPGGDGVAEDEQVDRVAVRLLVVPVRRAAPARPAACRSPGAPGRPAGAAARGRRTPSRRRRRRRRPAPRRPGSGACRHATLQPHRPEPAATPGDGWPNGTTHVGRCTHDNGPATRHAGAHDRLRRPAHPPGPTPPARLAARRGRRLDLPGHHQRRPGRPHLRALPRRRPHPLQHRPRPALPRRRLRRHRPHLAGRREPRPALPRGALRRRHRSSGWPSSSAARPSPPAGPRRPLVGAVRLLAALGIGAVIFQAAQSLQVPAFEPRLLGLWAAGALLHGYLARANTALPRRRRSPASRGGSPSRSGTSPAASPSSSSSAPPPCSPPAWPCCTTAGSTRFAWTWRTVAGGMALLALFAAAIPDIGGDGVAWSPWLVVASSPPASRPPRPLVAGARRTRPRAARRVVVLVVATLLGLWTTGTDTTDIDASDWLHAAVSVVAYVVLAVALVALGTVREHTAADLDGDGRARRLHDLPELRRLRADRHRRLALRGARHGLPRHRLPLRPGPARAGPGPRHRHRHRHSNGAHR